jgi:DinB superfamily
VRAALERAVQALDAAIAGACGRWQVPLGESEWPPCTVAAHIVIALGVYSEFMADALGEPYYDWASQDFTFTSADTARSALKDISMWGRGFLMRLEDDSALDTPVPEMAGSSRLPPTIEGVLTMATNHLNEHARQIGGLPEWSARGQM